MERTPGALARLATGVLVIGIAHIPSEAAERRTSRIALLVDFGLAREAHDPQSLLLTDPTGFDPQLGFDHGPAYGLALDIQLAPVLVLRAAYEASESELELTIFPPPGLAHDAVVASTRYRALRLGVFLHGLLRRDLFAPDAEFRVMGRYGVSVARSRLGSVAVTAEADEALEILSVSTPDAWVFALEAEFIARFGRSRWFGGIGVLLTVGPGPELVVEPVPGAGFVKSEFEYRSNRLTSRLGYRF